MRTPEETFERLAELAPQECYLSVSGYLNVKVPCTTSTVTCASAGGSDVGNARFMAWCKRKLREMGWWCDSYYAKDHCHMSAGKHGGIGSEFSVDCPTEWQASAECLIKVLEQEGYDENESD